MKKYLSLILLIAASCQPAKKTTDAKVALTSDEYNTPYFEDAQRAANVVKVAPVIDSVFARYARANHNPAISYGIVVDNQLVHTGSVGYANLQNKTLAATDTRFRIASMTKSFTAMAILRLRDEGKLQLTDPASNYIPEMRDLRYPTHDGSQVTIFHLLTMSSGFPEDNPWGDRQLSDTDEELLALVKQGISFSNNPGAAYEYSNLGYALLGKIVANVSGMRYQDYVIKNILEPLGMKDCTYEYENIPADKLAMGYRWEDDQWKPEPLLKDGSYASMGGMICTIHDFAKYMSFLLTARPPRQEAENGPVSRASARELQQPWKFNRLAPARKTHSGELCPTTYSYGFGLGWRKDCHDITTVTHSGGLPGFGSVHMLLPELGVGIVAFSNLTYANMGAPTSRALDTLVLLAHLTKRVFPVSPILKSMQQSIMKVLPDWNDQYDSLFAENFFPDHSKERRKKQYNELLAKVGKVISVKEMRPENLLRGTFDIECEKGTIQVFFTLTPDANPKIQFLEVSLRDEKQ